MLTLCGKLGRVGSANAFWRIVASSRLIVRPLTWTTASKSPVNAFAIVVGLVSRAGSDWEVFEVPGDVRRGERLLVENHFLDLTEERLTWHRRVESGIGVLVRRTDQEEGAVGRRV